MKKETKPNKDDWRRAKVIWEFITVFDPPKAEMKMMAWELFGARLRGQKEARAALSQAKGGKS